MRPADALKARRVYSLTVVRLTRFEYIDLATVEEMDTQIAIDDAPGTPPRNQPGVVSYRSPGAVSEMSGTTAITSFSMAEVEAEDLEPRFIVRYLPKLYAAVKDFLQHLAPDEGRRQDDLANIRDIRKPDSEFNKDYREFAAEVNLYLKHFRGDRQQYILLRAVHHALVGSTRDIPLIQSGLDVPLYLANLLIFAKYIISSDRSENETWDVLHNLDADSFPSLFLSALVPASSLPDPAYGASTLLKETLGLALELRTQLAILTLQRSAEKGNYDPDEVLGELFVGSDDEEGNRPVIRGWAIPGLEELSEEGQRLVTDRMDKIREFFPTDTESLERGDTADVEGLLANFPWEGTVLRALHWVRLRTREIESAIQEQGDIAEITAKVKKEIEHAAARPQRATSVPQGTPRKKRTSFGRDRRRSSKRFDPNADLGEVDALKAREKAAQHTQEEPQELAVNQPVEQDELQATPNSDIVIDGDKAQQQLEVSASASGPSREVQPTPHDDIDIDGHEDQQQPEPLTRPPRSAAELEKLTRKMLTSNPQNKENVRGGFFTRQPNAQRVEFGDGFDESQPIAGPSRSSAKGKGKAKESELVSSKKRRREAESADSDDDDAFESAAPSLTIQERRKEAPVAKKARFNVPISSAAPPSNQPPPRNDFELEAQEESFSEAEAPEMSEEAPPPSSFAKIKMLAQSNVVPRQRKRPTAWSPEEEQALERYIGILGPKYSAILNLDADPDEGFGLLQERTQVNLKDKARNMAITMIK
jgi:hypothetical protein